MTSEICSNVLDATLCQLQLYTLYIFCNQKEKLWKKNEKVKNWKKEKLNKMWAQNRRG